jgi:hypothetical protein
MAQPMLGDRLYRRAQWARFEALVAREGWIGAARRILR